MLLFQIQHFETGLTRMTKSIGTALLLFNEIELSKAHTTAEVDYFENKFFVAVQDLEIRISRNTRDIIDLNRLESKLSKNQSYIEGRVSHLETANLEWGIWNKTIVTEMLVTIRTTYLYRNYSSSIHDNFFLWVGILLKLYFHNNLIMLSAVC